MSCQKGQTSRPRIELSLEQGLAGLPHRACQPVVHVAMRSDELCGMDGTRAVDHGFALNVRHCVCGFKVFKVHMVVDVLGSSFLERHIRPETTRG